jgi:hypothetical protein
MDAQLFKELEAILQLNVGANFYKYRDIYFKVFNRQGPGCKCHGNTMYNELNNVYILEKQRYESSRQSETTT